MSSEPGLESFLLGGIGDVAEARRKADSCCRWSWRNRRANRDRHSPVILCLSLWQTRLALRPTEQTLENVPFGYYSLVEAGEDARKGTYTMPDKVTDLIGFLLA